MGAAANYGTPAFKKNTPRQMNAKKMRRARRLTMFKVPRTPTLVPMRRNIFPEGNVPDMNRSLSLNLILKDIGMGKYLELFMKEEVSQRG